MRLHDALGDGEPKSGSLPAVGVRRIGLDEFLENKRQGLRRNAGAIVGDAQHDLLRDDRRIDHHARFRRRMRDRIADHITDRLLDQRGVGAHQRQIGRQSDLDSLPRAAPPGGIDDAIDDFAQIDPVAPQFQCARIDACDGEQIAHHLVEPLGLLLDLQQHVLLGCGASLSP